jgi:hypothetical protein
MMEPWCDELELALTNRQDFRREGTPVNGDAANDMRLILRAAWHGAMHAFDDTERQKIIDAIERVERAL